MRNPTFFLAAALLVGCGDWKLEPAELTARSSAPAPGLSCAGCHAYPLNDTNHIYHLLKTAGNRLINGPITCLDCHSTAMRSRELAIEDSIYSSPDGSRYSTTDYPVMAGTPSLADTLRTFHLDTVITLHQHRPIPMPDRFPIAAAGPAYNRGSDSAVPAGMISEYMTGLAHLNGAVDVVFDSRVSAPGDFNGQMATFNPVLETCSAVACHGSEKAFRWPAPSKQFDFLPKD